MCWWHINFTFFWNYRHFPKVVKSLQNDLDPILYQKKTWQMALSGFEPMRLNLLYANKYILNYKMLEKLHNTSIFFIFNYSSLIYYPYLDTLSQKHLESFQNICCRFVYNSLQFDHVSLKVNQIGTFLVSSKAILLMMHTILPFYYNFWQKLPIYAVKNYNLYNPTISIQ